MHNLFRLDSPLFQLLNKLTDLLVLNILTLIFSLPIVTAGASVTALYDAVWRIVEDEGNVYRSYIHAFRANFKKSTLLWLIVLGSGLIMYFSLLFYETADVHILTTISHAALWLWGMTTAWIFPIQSRFENTIGKIIKNSFLCAIGHLPRSLLMAILNLFPWFLLLDHTAAWFKFGLLWLLIWFSMTAYLNTWIIRNTFHKLMGKPIPEKKSK